MSDQIQELIDIPRDFIKDGTMFINRCTKRKSLFGLSRSPAPCADGNSGQARVCKDIPSCWRWILGHGWYLLPSPTSLGQKLTFLKPAVGYVVKLSTGPFYRLMSTDTDQRLIVHIPVNNILVGGA
jgi:hypothetical protein